jgi:ribonuclease PH
MMGNSSFKHIAVVLFLFLSRSSIFCTMINAIYLALMSAGIAMYDSFLSCSVGYFYHNQQIIVDLNQLEIFGNDNTIFLPIVVKGKSEEVIFMELNHRCKLELLEDLLNNVMSGCRTIRSYLENAIKDYMVKQLEKQ